MSSFTPSPGLAADQSQTPNLNALAEDAGQKIQKGVDTAVHAAQDAVGDLQQEATKIAGDAVEKAKSYADENKGKVAGQVESIASALTKAADELETSEQGAIAGYARQLAGGVNQFSTAIRDKGVDELIGMVGQFAKSNPAAFIGGAALLGFAASRFAMAGVKAGADAATSNEAPRQGSPVTAEPWQSSGPNGQGTSQPNPGDNGPGSSGGGRY